MNIAIREAVIFMENRKSNMVYEKPKVLKEENIDVQQLVAGCGMTQGGGIDCAVEPNQTPSGH